MRRLLALCCLLLPLPVLAGTVYRCLDTHGRVSYQDSPCPHGSRQQVRSFAPASTPPPVPHAATSAPAAPAPAPVAMPPMPAVATAAPPRLFRCTRATDGHTYLSDRRYPPAYLVPAGMLDWHRPLAEVYGSDQGKGVGMSAPELMPDPTPALIGSRYVRVRDRCRPLSIPAACIALRHQQAANTRAIDHAFASDRAPLVARRKALRRQLADCPQG